jgi:hypothetical protein
MCVTTEVEGKEKFMGAEKRQKKAQEIANSLGEGVVRSLDCCSSIIVLLFLLFVF